MAERKPILFRPSEEDWDLIEKQIEYHGGEPPEALRRGLRAGDREIELLKEAHRVGAKAARAKGKGSARRKP